MKKLSLNLSLLAVAVVAVSALGAAPVSAQRIHVQAGDDTAVSVDGSTGSVDVRAGDVSISASGSGSVNSGELKAEIQARIQAFRERANELLEQRRENAKSHSVAVRQKVCEAREQSIETRSQNFSKSAAKHLSVFDGIYNKVLAYQSGGDVTPDNFADLKAAADSKQAAAQTAVQALSTLDVQIDCTATDPATQVATLKSAVDASRTSLQDYRTAIKNLVVALMTAKGSAAADGQGATTQTGTEE